MHWRGWRIDRYFLTELLGPFFLGLLVYTFIMLIDFFFDSAEMIIRRGVEAGIVGKLLVYYLPSTLVLTLPMALLFGILVAIGRLAGDSELTAMRSTGLSLWRMLRPIVAFSVVLTALTGYLTLSFLPLGNSALNDLRMEIITSSITKQVDERVFYEEFQGLILYVFETPPDEDRWKGVFLASTKPGTKGEIRFAEWGEIRGDPDDRNKLLLHLENVLTHEVDFNRPANYRTSQYRSVDMVIEDPYAADKEAAKRRRYKSLRELTVPQLRERLEQPELPVQLRNKARIEIHKKFAIPFACLVFGLLGLPLGFSRQQSGKATGFILSIAVIFVYWFLISNGEKAATDGSLAPWLAMWLPNLTFLALAVLLLGRKNRDRSLLPHRLDLWVRSVLGEFTRSLKSKLKRRQEERRLQYQHQAAGGGRSAAAPNIVLRLPQLRLKFPNRLDRYILALFLTIFCIAVLSGVALITVGMLTEKIDEVLDNDIPWSVVFRFLGWASLQGIYEFVPIAVLVTTLAAFGILTKRNEVTAIKALGVSLYRLAIPAIAGALLVVAVTVWMQNEILPAANERASELEDVIHDREQRRGRLRADRNWLFGRDKFIYNYLHYDQRGQTLQRLQVFEVNEDRGITRRLYATSARYVGDGWRFEDAWTRSFDGLDTTEYARYEEPILAAFPETPEYFESEIKPPDSLSYGQLKEHIAELEASGQDVPELRVRLYSKISNPVISLVMALVALPFAFRLGRRGALYGIGIGVILGMVLLATVAFAGVLGETGTLPPLLAAWAPVVVFSLLSMYVFLGVET